MSEITAPVKLAGYFLEWDGIETEKAALAERSKDLFKAMKDEGYNTKAARVTFRDKRAEQSATAEDVAKAEADEAELDLYRSALDRGLADRAHPAPAHVEKIEEFDAETGEITESVPANPRPFTPLATRGADESVATLLPDPHSKGLTAGGPNPSLDADGAKSDGPPVAGQGGHEPVHQNIESGQQSASAAQDDNPVVSASGASATISDADVPAFLKNDHPVKTARDYRPHCQNPEACASSGLHHCYTCAKALAAESEAA